MRVLLIAGMGLWTSAALRSGGIASAGMASAFSLLLGFNELWALVLRRRKAEFAEATRAYERILARAG
jgi:hypothetical protein